MSVLPGTDVRPDSDVRQDLSVDNGDHERFAHYVVKDKIVDSAVNGTPVVALCGKVWVPSRDPKKFPVCPDCQRIYESLPEGGESSPAGTAGVPASVMPAPRSFSSAAAVVCGSTPTVRASSTDVSKPALAASAAVA